MFDPWLCPGATHVPPATGGSCPCGMVTRIPAPKRPPAGPPPEVLAMLTHLDEWTQSLEAAASRLLREQVDRLTAALSATGLVPSAGDPHRLMVPPIEAAQVAALAYTAPPAAAGREAVTAALESPRATLSAVVNRSPSELDARQAEVAASATASSHDTGKADTLRPPASGNGSAPPRPMARARAHRRQAVR